MTNLIGRFLRNVRIYAVIFLGSGPDLLGLTFLGLGPEPLAQSRSPGPNFSVEGLSSGNLRPHANLSSENVLQQLLLVVVEVAVDLPRAVVVNRLPAYGVKQVVTMKDIRNCEQYVAQRTLIYKGMIK